MRKPKKTYKKVPSLLEQLIALSKDYKAYRAVKPFRLDAPFERRKEILEILSDSFKSLSIEEVCRKVKRTKSSYASCAIALRELVEQGKVVRVQGIGKKRVFYYRIAF